MREPGPALWARTSAERRHLARRRAARESAHAAERIAHALGRFRPADARQQTLWAESAASARQAERRAKRILAREANYQTMHGRPLDAVDAHLAEAAGLLVTRVRHLDARTAVRAGRAVMRRHRRAVESGRWARRFGALQGWRARRQSGPRLDRCAARDRRIVRLRRSGHSWRAIAGRVGCSHVNCQGAPARLRKRAARRNRERLERRRAARAARRAAERARAACQGGNRANRHRPRYSETSCEVWDPVGAAHLPRARVRPGERSTFGALRRAGYWTWCNFEPGVPDDERVEIVKRMAAKGRIAYDGLLVGSAVDAARFLWERNGQPGVHVAPALEPNLRYRRPDRTRTEPDTARRAPLGNLGRRKAALHAQPGNRAAFDAFMALRGRLPAGRGVGTPAAKRPEGGANAGGGVGKTLENGPNSDREREPAGGAERTGASRGAPGARRDASGFSVQSGRRC